MPYVLYIIICYLTLPLRTVMFWWSNRNIDFAVRLLFWNSYKHSLIMGQAFKESSFQSRRYREDNNAFGMGYTASGYGRPSSDEPGGQVYSLAKYRDIYTGVYDYYHYIYKRVPTIGKILNNTPTANFSKGSPLNPTYVYQVIAAMRSVIYFTAPLVDYYPVVQSYVASYKDSRVYFVINCVGTALTLPLLIRLFYRYVLHKKEVPFFRSKPYLKRLSLG